MMILDDNKSVDRISPGLETKFLETGYDLGSQICVFTLVVIRVAPGPIAKYRINLASWTVLALETVCNPVYNAIIMRARPPRSTSLIKFLFNLFPPNKELLSFEFSVSLPLLLLSLLLNSRSNLDTFKENKISV